MSVLQRRDLATVMAMVLTGAALVGVLGLLVPGGGNGPVAPRVAGVAVSTALAGTLWLRRDRAGGRLGELGLVWLEIGVLHAIAVDPDPGSAGFLHLALVWMAVLAFGFLPRRRAWTHVLATTGLAATNWVLDGAGTGEVVVAGGMLVASCAGAGELVARLVQRAEVLARTDELTGIANRRGVLHRLDDEAVALPQLLLLDLDGFKAVNDEHGHAAGDALLADVARRWVAALPGDAVVGRLGGDEFVVALPGDLEDAVRAAALVRGATPPGVTVSVGHAERAPDQPLHVAMAHADDAMYAAKRVGRGAPGTPSGQPTPSAAARP